MYGLTLRIQKKERKKEQNQNFMLDFVNYGKG